MERRTRAQVGMQKLLRISSILESGTPPGMDFLEGLRMRASARKYAPATSCCPAVQFN